MKTIQAPHCIFGAVLLLLSIYSNHSFGSLIVTDHVTYGNGSLTLDQSTGREWLDLTQTTGLSVDQFETMNGPGGQFEGFVVASVSDVQELILNSGWSGSFSTNYINDETRYLEAVSLIQLVGTTFSSTEPRAGSYGLTTDTVAGGYNRYGGVYTENPASTPYASSMSFNFIATSSPSAGVWSFRAVPEPSSALLLGTGTFGLIAFYWRRRSNKSVDSTR